MYLFELYNIEPGLMGYILIGFFLTLSLVTVYLLNRHLKNTALQAKLLGGIIFILGTIIIDDLLIGMIFFEEGEYINYGALRGLAYIIGSMILSILIIYVITVIFLIIKRKLKRN